MDARVVGFATDRNIGDYAYRTAFELLMPGRRVEYGEICPQSGDSILILGGGDVVLPAYTKTFSGEQASRTTVASVSVTSGSDFDFIRRARRVIVRDSASSKLCLEQGREVELLPDFAFVLRADPERGREWLEKKFSIERKDLYSKLAVLIPNGYTFFGGNNSRARDFAKAIAVADDLAWICDNTPASFLILPFGTYAPADDRTPALYIESRCKWHMKVLAVAERLDVQTTLDVISAADAVIGNRLHGLIFATIGSTPFVALSHHSKIADFAAEVGKSNWLIDFHDFNRGRVFGLLGEHLSSPDHGDLAAYSLDARTQILSSQFP